MAEAYLMDIVSVKVQITPSLKVCQIAAFAAAERVQTWRRQGLMEKVARILFK
jgi:hypothetical protein